MDIHELIAAVKIAGLRCTIAKTGHPEFKRGFITNGNGVSLGRAVIQNDVFSHIKWYVAQTGDLSVWDYEMYAVDYAIATGKFLHPTNYKLAVHKAAKLAQEDLERKKEWRRANPYSGNGKRGRLTGKHLRSFLWELILNEPDQ